ncbi:MAG: FKBP-type peptidyl-prolyl cis-trans isomerase [Bacteroidales bacterium]|nr:FKBP-type peptidyl-prolyl cis-trans isomerase [Bacteroidales bacterium]
MKILKSGLFIFCTSILFLSCTQLTKDTKIVTSADSVSYAIGVSIGSNIKPQFEDIDPYIIAKGIEDVYNEKETMFDLTEANNFINKYAYNKYLIKADDNKKRGETFLNENRDKPGVITTESGLQYKIIEEGVGPSPRLKDQVKVHYKGALIDGTVFDSSYDRGEPATFQVTRVIKGWTEALLLMKTGSKWVLYIPSDLAYGLNGSRNKIGPNETLIFDVELIEIIRE